MTINSQVIWFSTMSLRIQSFDWLTLEVLMGWMRGQNYWGQWWELGYSSGLWVCMGREGQKTMVRMRECMVVQIVLLRHLRMREWYFWKARRFGQRVLECKIWEVQFHGVGLLNLKSWGVKRKKSEVRISDEWVIQRWFLVTQDDTGKESKEQP